MIKYFPLTRIKTDLYTRGISYKLPNGQPYTGRYYLLYDGTAYTGANPVVGSGDQLTPIDSPLDTLSGIGVNSSIQYLTATSQDTTTSKALNTALSNQELQTLKPFYPIPIESDYQLGYFTRYFAKNVTGPGYILEISQNDYANVKNGIYTTAALAYEVVNLLWQLTGPLKDTRVSQYQIKGGVFDTNKRVTETRAVGFRGLVEYIGGDYTKFARITP